MNCPRCNKTLQPQIVKDVKTSIEVDKCNSCGGVWFDRGELNKIDKIVEPTFIEIRKIPNLKEQLAVLNCPSCKEKTILQKVEHPRDLKVVMDFCPKCQGIWLDKSELEAIQNENWITTFGRIFRWLFGKD